MRWKLVSTLVSVLAVLGVSTTPALAVNGQAPMTIGTASGTYSHGPTYGAANELTYSGELWYWDFDTSISHDTYFQVRVQDIHTANAPDVLFSCNQIVGGDFAESYPVTKNYTSAINIDWGPAPAGDYRAEAYNAGKDPTDFALTVYAEPNAIYEAY